MCSIALSGPDAFGEPVVIWDITESGGASGGSLGEFNPIDIFGRFFPKPVLPPELPWGQLPELVMCGDGFGMSPGFVDKMITDQEPSQTPDAKDGRWPGEATERYDVSDTMVVFARAVEGGGVGQLTFVERIDAGWVMTRQLRTAC